MKFKDFFSKNKHILFLLYMPVYLYCFTWLEARNDVSFTEIHCFLDDWIPFSELFIIPYLLWFVYVAAVIVFLYFQKEHLEDYYRCIITLLLGMSASLLIYFLFPNEQNLRPSQFLDSNFLTDIIQFIYDTDTNTNVLPSIHVYNSIAIMIAVWRSRCFTGHRIIKAAMLLLGVSIICSTVLIKQHSMLDVLLALLLASVMYAICYKKETVREGKTALQKSE